MSEDLIVSQCSPTLAGLKTGNMFTCPIENKEDLMDSICRLNGSLVPKGVRLIPLKFMKKRVLIYMYRPQKLQEDLKDKTAFEILSKKNYPTEDMDKCIVELIRRLNHDENFPHEIGLFLGYPSEDVSGFIKSGAKQAKCIGTWKVYGDEEAAKRKFELYKKCTKSYCNAYNKLNSFDRLIVSG